MANGEIKVFIKLDYEQLKEAAMLSDGIAAALRKAREAMAEGMAYAMKLGDLFERAEKDEEVVTHNPKTHDTLVS